MPTFLTLDENHVYRLDGVAIPSVTQIIKSAGMMGWMPEDEYYRQRGQYVHDAIKMYFKGTLDIDALSEGVRPYVDSAIEYILVTGYRPALVECLMYSPIYRYAGTPDAWPLLDWKTGGKQSWHAPQMAAYYNLALENGIETTGIYPINVHLRPDGKLPKVEPYKFTEIIDAKKAFFSALHVYQWRKNNNLLKEDV